MATHLLKKTGHHAIFPHLQENIRWRLMEGGSRINALLKIAPAG
jgi:hypothetical protein